MKKVYFYLIFGYDYNNNSECKQSENFNSIEEAFESKKRHTCITSPVMEGWIKE